MLLPNESRLSCGRKTRGRPIRPFYGTRQAHKRNSSLLGRARQLQALVRRRRPERLGQGIAVSSVAADERDEVGILRERRRRPFCLPPHLETRWVPEKDLELARRNGGAPWIGD